MTLKRRKLKSNRDLILLTKALLKNQAPGIKQPRILIAFQDEANAKQFIEEYKEIIKNENNPS